jgi:hypothetical protein
MKEDAVRSLVVWLVASLLTAASLVAQQDCSRFMVLDTANSQTDQQLYRNVYNVVCRSESSDRQSASQAAMKLGIPVPVLGEVFDMSFGGSTASSNYASWRSSFCSTSSEQVTQRFAQQSLSSRFSDNARNTIETCLTTQVGHYGYFEPSAQRTAFSFTYRYKPVGNERADLVEAYVTPGSAVRDCNPAKVFHESPGWDLRLQVTATCSWDSSKDVTVTVRTSKGNRAFQLGGLRAVPPPPTVVATPAPSLRSRLAAGYTLTVRIDRCIGSIMGGLYLVSYVRPTRGWIGEGPHGDGNCPPHSNDYQRNDTYTCGNFASLCDIKPEDGRFVIWGHDFGFDENGKVFDNNVEVGAITGVS